ncbi:MAG: hypothetical protein ABIK86_05675 [candidate division WOR-3 bacterium]
MRRFELRDLSPMMYWFDVVAGTSSEPLLLFDCWTDTAYGRAYDNQRVWGRFGPFIGLAEAPAPHARRRSTGPTILRGILNLQSATCNLHSEMVLLDVSGRKVLDLAPGPNDLSGLAPGVYFVREVGAEIQTGTVRKVVIQR